MLLRPKIIAVTVRILLDGRAALAYCILIPGESCY